MGWNEPDGGEIEKTGFKLENKKNSPIFLIPRGLKKLNVTKTRMHIGIKEIRELEKRVNSKSWGLLKETEKKEREETQKI